MSVRESFVVSAPLPLFFISPMTSVLRPPVRANMAAKRLKKFSTATAVQTPQNPDPTPGASPRRNMPPPPPPSPPPQASASATAALSPSFSRAPIRARLGASDSSSPDEHPCVTLWDWWLVRVEGDERKIAVSGFTERNDAFTSAPIAKCYEPLTLQDEDGVVVLIHGSLSILGMLENGFSLQICEQFLIGFPYWWESWNSHMESQSSSSNTSNSRESSTQFYLEKFQLGKFLEKEGPSFIKNLLNNAKDFPSDDADAFENCSFLSNETPRFEEYTGGNDISTKEKSAASNDGSVGKEVDNAEIDLIANSTSQERGHVDIEGNVSLAPTEKNSDEIYKEGANQKDTMHPDAREQETGSHLVNHDLICNRSPDLMPSDLEDGNTNAGNSVDLVSKYLLATVPPEKAHCCSETTGALENLPLLSCQRTPVASLKNQGCLKRTKHISLNQKAHQSPLTRGMAKSLSISTPESLKMKRTRSGRVVVPPLDPGSEWIVYDINGLISGVRVESQSPLKGSKSGTPARKRTTR